MTVLNMHRLPKREVPADAVYVGRPSPWQNPFKVGAGRRGDAIAKFREYAEVRIKEQPEWLEPLRGKDVVCWCAPLACHADVLMEMLER